MDNQPHEPEGEENSGVGCCGPIITVGFIFYLVAIIDSPVMWFITLVITVILIGWGFFLLGEDEEKEPAEQKQQQAIKKRTDQLKNDPMMQLVKENEKIQNKPPKIPEKRKRMKKNPPPPPHHEFDIISLPGQPDQLGNYKDVRQRIKYSVVIMRSHYKKLTDMKETLKQRIEENRMIYRKTEPFEQEVERIERVCAFLSQQSWKMYELYEHLKMREWKKELIPYYRKIKDGSVTRVDLRTFRAHQDRAHDIRNTIRLPAMISAWDELIGLARDIDDTLLLALSKNTRKSAEYHDTSTPIKDIQTDDANFLVDLETTITDIKTELLDMTRILNLEELQELQAKFEKNWD